jgi:hypothetical protein
VIPPANVIDKNQCGFNPSLADDRHTDCLVRFPRVYGAVRNSTLHG